MRPKASYLKGLDWDGTPASIGAGAYRRDLPGTCRSEEVNALLLEDEPSNERLAEFVRCAALELESQGYFAVRALSSDPRWRSRSIYLFGLDTYGNTLFSGDPYSQWFGALAPELNAHRRVPSGAVTSSPSATRSGRRSSTTRHATRPPGDSRGR